MTRRTVDFRTDDPLFEIVSHGRGGPHGRPRLPQAQIEAIRRTVQRVSEAVVKVLPTPANTLATARKHADYIGRYGRLALETDDGDSVGGKGAGRRLLEDWDLDLDEHRRRSDLAAANGRKPPPLVHKLMLSMPAGTSAQGVLKAARNFLREEFALQHRYAFVLHTDEPHPHVHVLLKAVSEQGIRLNIKKEHLRHWRREFAHHLRAQGIAANATERQARGQTKTTRRDPIYRATQRRASTFARDRVQSVALQLRNGDIHVEPGKSKLNRTRKEVERKWNTAAEILEAQGELELAAYVREFANDMPPPRTDREQIAAELLARAKQPPVKDSRPAR